MANNQQLLLGEGAGSAPAVYIEDVFSTYLYDGTGATQTITNNIDLSTKGGLVWMKGRSGATDHALYDTARGATKDLVSNSTAAETTQATGLTAFSGTGFSIGALAKLNTNAATYASWTFRKQAKFFDIVTYTGDGSASPRQIAHSLGSVPGFIVIKRTDTTSDWTVWHRSVTGNAFLQTTDAWQTGYTRITTPDSTTFTVGASTMVNASGGTYVAYLFAHNAGGFGLSGTDNVISCASYTTASTSDSPIISLGYEPQLVLVKLTNISGDWRLFDNMRGVVTGGNDRVLKPNSSAAEVSFSAGITFNSTGFQQSPDIDTGANSYIYIAIRRGPMKVPTSGTSVFSPVAHTGTGTTTVIGSLPVVDAVISMNRSGTTLTGSAWYDRLRGLGRWVMSSNTNAENSNTTTLSGFDTQQGVRAGTDGEGTINTSTVTYVLQNFRRAPGFFDVVCYTGTGVARTVAHNLAAVPQMIIVKNRGSGIRPWRVYHVDLGNTYYLTLNENVARQGPSGSFWNSTTPTSSVFSVGTSSDVNQSTLDLVAYLFATVAGVSKVGSYTGTGTTQVINCGFTAGSRFVMIKRTDSTGDWYVWDSARGIVAGNDPYLLLNSTAAEVTSTDYVDTAATGFEISSTAPAAINASAGTFIFLAIA